MTIETYRELFHCLAFPVFVASGENALIYKNPACETYLPKIYKGRTLKDKICPELPQKSMVLRIFGGMSYSTALALKDEENMVFLCFSRFQYPDGLLVATSFLHRFGDTLLDFISGFKQYLYLASKPSLENEKLFDIIQDELSCFEQKNFSLSDLLTPIFQKLSECFSVLGYRLNVKIDKSFPQYLFVRVSPNDILFLLSKLIYLIIKYSENKEMEFALFPDFANSKLSLRLMTKTNLKGIPKQQDDVICLLKELVPEYAMEFELLNRGDFLKNVDISIHRDSLGMLCAIFHFPYSDPGTTGFRSVDDIALLFSENIRIMVENILSRIRDKDASC